MRDKEEDFNIELKILENYYDIFNFGNSKIFVSSFEDKESKDLIGKEYTQIAKSYNNEVIFINNARALKALLITPTLENFYTAQTEKIFKDKTFIVDVDNAETVEMVKGLKNISYHLNKNTQATLHLFLKSEHIRDYIVGSDLWEFREKTFHYSAGEVAKIKFKQMMESTLDIKPSIITKQKI